MAKDEKYAASQSVTTVGVVGQVVNIISAEELIKQTAKRSVFSAEAFHEMSASRLSPVKMIEFLLVSHIEPSVPLSTLVAKGIFSNRPPQSIAELGKVQYADLRPYLRLGFDL
jgi:hypothetical protein